MIFFSINKNIIKIIYLILQELLDDDVSIIDSGDNVYVWIGSQASELEKELAIIRAEVNILANLT